MSSTVPSSSAPASAAPPELVDIGSNLSDPVFRGSYHGKQVHPDDLKDVLSRARRAGVHTQLLTGDSLQGSRDVLELARQFDGLYTTVGCHPCRASEFEEHGPDKYMDELAALIEEDRQSAEPKVRAVGECGLDYDRLFLCPKETQLKYFPRQLDLASRFDLPLFLHSRAAHDDMMRILREHGKPMRGVVHSHTGTLQEALDMINLGFYIGLNGCSLKTEENLECAKGIPLEHVMVESDCPWCEIRPSHASSRHLDSLKSPGNEHYAEVWLPPSVNKKEKWAEGKMVRGRQEPVGVGQVAWVLSRLHGVDVEEVARVTTENAKRVFSLARASAP